MSTDAASVAEEIRLLLVEALREGDVVRPDEIAKYVASAYPRSGLSQQQIADRIRTAAIQAGVQTVSGTAPNRA